MNVDPQAPAGHRGLGHLPALLAAPARRHRLGAGQRRRAGHPRRRLLRRGHHHAGGRGGAPRPGGRPGGRRGAGPVPLHAGPGLPRQDERDDGARGAGAGPGLRRLRLRRLVALGGRHAAPGAGAGRVPGAPGGGRTTLAVVSDLRTGLAGSAEERDSGDGAAAFVCAPEGAVAELVGRGAASDEFLDRWRVPGEADSHVWEERFGEELYVPLAREAFAAALKDAGLAEGDVDHAIVTGLHVRAVKAAAGGLGVRDGVLAPDLHGSVGQPRRRAGRRGAVRRARARRAGAGDRRAVAGRRRRRLRPAHDRRAGRRAAGPGRGGRAVAWPSRWPRGGTTCPTPRS